MKLTDDHIELLKTAKDDIESGSGLFVCLALTKTDTDDFSRSKPLLAAIGMALGDKISLDSWVSEKMNMHRSDFVQIYSISIRRLMRMAWIDRMIETGEIK